MANRIRHAGTDAQMLALLAASIPAATGGLGAADLFLGDKKAWNSGELPINALLTTLPMASGMLGYGAYTLVDPILREQFLNYMSSQGFGGANKTPDMVAKTRSQRVPGFNEAAVYPTGEYQAQPGTPGVSPRREAEAKRVLDELYSTGRMPHNATIPANETILNRRSRNRMAVAALLSAIGGASAVNKMNSNERQSLS